MFPDAHEPREATVIRALLIGTLLLLVAADAYAQQSVIQRKALITEDGPPGFQTIVFSVEFAPGAREAKHTHPGPLIGYILEGTLDLEHEGRATATYKAGEAFYVEPGKGHLAINSSGKPVKFIATLFVEKGKPASSPVSEQSK
jgi:quercetin dioxygenase-like cupin family protein